MRNQLTTGNPPAANTSEEISRLMTYLDKQQEKVEAVENFCQATGLPELAELAGTKIQRIERWREIAHARLARLAGTRREAVIAQLPTKAAA